MSAANPIVVTAPTTSTWESIQNAVVDSSKWLGRQVNAFFTGIKDYAIKLYEWAKPFFVHMGKFFVESYQTAKDFVVQHKESVGAAVVAFFTGIIITVVSQSLCCGQEKDKPADTSATTKP